ncbi:MAG: prephenate dehydratase [Polyangiaceae bacterium]|nr:prephenate dehydratase [Polyangiaceae bacterium]
MSDAPDLVALRARIDELDDRLLDLLDDRARVAEAIGRVKRERAAVTLHDPEREERVLSRLAARQAARGAAAFPAASVRPVFREVMSACLSLEQPIAVGYLGPPGTFTHLAARTAFGLAARYVESSTIGGVFEAVERGRVAVGVVPMENSTEGSVTFTLDGFLEHEVQIRSELVLDVAQCLLASFDDLARVERVYSHPQAIAQCRRWLASNLPQAQIVTTPSTAAAAREAEQDDAGAAIASRLAAELGGLRVIREAIQDRALNATRFVVLAPQDAPPTGDDRTSLVFSTPNERGALRRALDAFEAEGVNLSRIESRPAGDRPWEYVFFTDLDGHRADPAVSAALDRLRGLGGLLRVLGSYPRARRSGG